MRCPLSSTPDCRLRFLSALPARHEPGRGRSRTAGPRSPPTRGATRPPPGPGRPGPAGRPGVLIARRGAPCTASGKWEFQARCRELPPSCRYWRRAAVPSGTALPGPGPGASDTGTFRKGVRGPGPPSLELTGSLRRLDEDSDAGSPQVRGAPCQCRRQPGGFSPCSPSIPKTPRCAHRRPLNNVTSGGVALETR